MIEESRDVVVVGSGPAGMAAALYASRANLDVVLIERGLYGGELLNTETIENYLGGGQVRGQDLANKMRDDAIRFGAVEEYGDVTSVKVLEDGSYEVKIEDKLFKSPVVIIATGCEGKKLGVEGEEFYHGRGVSSCAVCDGIFFSNKNISVIGGGDSAVEEGIYLTQYGKNIDIVHRRDELRAQEIIKDRAFDNKKITFEWNNTLEEIKGDGNRVTSVVLKNTIDGSLSEKDTDGVFIYIGKIPNSDMVKDLDITDEDGWILADSNGHTSLPGLFAVGDIRKKELRQVITAVSEGSIAGQEAYHYIQNRK